VTDGQVGSRPGDPDRRSRAVQGRAPVEGRRGRSSGVRPAGADLARDLRFALHGPTVHPEEGNEGAWPGEAKIAGRAVAVPPSAGAGADGQPHGELVVADSSEVVVTGTDAGATRPVIEWWRPRRPPGQRQGRGAP